MFSSVSTPRQLSQSQDKASTDSLYRPGEHLLPWIDHQEVENEITFIEAATAKRLIDDEYTRHPFFGSRKMVVHLFRCGRRVNRKRVQRLMRAMFLAEMAPGPNTTTAHRQHKVHQINQQFCGQQQLWNSGQKDWLT